MDFHVFLQFEIIINIFVSYLCALQANYEQFGAL